MVPGKGELRGCVEVDDDEAGENDAMRLVRSGVMKGPQEESIALFPYLLIGKRILAKDRSNPGKGILLKFFFPAPGCWPWHPEGIPWGAAEQSGRGTSNGKNISGAP